MELTLSQPVFSGEARPRALKRLNRYYDTVARDFQRYAEVRLLSALQKAVKKAGDAAPVFPPLSPSLRWEVTRNGGGYLSVQYEERDDTDAPVTRYADCWSLHRGELMSLPELFKPRADWKDALLSSLISSAEARQRDGEVLTPKWKRVLKRRLRKDRFTFSDGGLSVFYPQGTLTSTGIPAFSVLTPRLRKLMKHPAMFEG